MHRQTVTPALPAPFIDAVMIDGVFTVLHYHIPAPITLARQKPLPVRVH